MRSRARKKSNLPTRIYSLSARYPTTNATVAHEQYFLANQYRNKLVEIELARLTAYRACVAEDEAVIALDAKVTPLTEKINALRGDVNAGKAATRSAKVLPETRKALKALIAERKPLYDELKAARLKARENPERKAQLDAIQQTANSAIREARGQCKVSWGTYLLVERAMETRDKSSDPYFARYKGTGRVGVQIHDRSLTVADVFAGKSNFLQIDPVKVYGRTKASRTTARLRLGSDGRLPVWVEFPILLHRELPLDAKVKWAWVHRVRDTSAYQSRDKDWTGFRYQLQLTLEGSSLANAQLSSNPRVCAVNFGWRKFGEQHLRAAFVVSEDGSFREFQIPEDLVSNKKHADGLEAVRGKHFEAVKALLEAWWASSPQDVPENAARLGQYAALLKSLDKLQDAIWRWKDERFLGDEALFDALETWRIKDRHLQRYENAVRQQLVNRRRAFHKDWALWLVNQYGVVIVDATDFRETKRKPLAEDADKVFKPRREQQSLMSPGVLRATILETCAKYGALTIKIRGQYEALFVLRCCG